MTTPGALEVSDSGAAVYSIPIAVPPGTAGMQPKLDVTYNSRGGDGLLGQGWSLGGLPAITRCKRTKAQDGTPGTVSFDANDRFCLDGQRLMLIAGSTYGGDNSEYRLERDSFTKIVSYGVAGGGPLWFKAWTKSGQILEFGNTADSRLESQQTAAIRLWSVSKILDTKGNYLTASYTKDVGIGQSRPARIDYTGNTAAGLATYASVRFVYVSRPSVSGPVYQGGSYTRFNSQLSKIQTFIGETMVMDYRLGYGTELLGTPRITSVAQCDGAGVCLPSTTIAWQDSFQMPGAPITSPSWSSGSGNPVIIGGDWNGDGKTDVMLQFVQGASGQGSGFTTLFQGTGSSFTAMYNDSWWHTGNYQIVPADFNGDGCTDWYFQARSTSFSNSIYTSNCQSWIGGSITPPAWTPTTNGPNAILGDWHADGITDVILQPPHPTPGGQISPPTSVFNSVGPYFNTGYQDGWWHGGSYNIVSGDFNGDGCSDWHFQSRAQSINGPVYLSNCQGFIAGTSFNDGGWWNTDNYNMLLGDFNGDGCTDWFLHAKSGASTSQTYFSNCNGSPAAIDGARFNPAGWHNWNIILGDFNGDGRTDFFLQPKYASGYDFWVFLSRGGHDFSGYILGFPAGFMDPGCKIATGDWNGDGATDLMFSCNGTITTYTTTFTPSLVSSITDGLGNQTTIAYAPISQGAPLYSKWTGATHPQVEFQGPLYVVSRVDAPNGLGTVRRTSFRYAGARANHYGRGFLGFGDMYALDEATGIETMTRYRQDHPHIGLVLFRTKSLGTAQLNRVDYTYTPYALGAGRDFVALTQAVEQSWELNGTAQGAAMPTVTTTYQYDGGGGTITYGNVTQVVVSTSDGYSKTTANTYTNDSTNWILGRLTAATVTSTTP